jgi:hypothetical protein
MLHIKTRYSESGTMAETRIGDEEFVNFPDSFASYVIHKLEESAREDEAKQAAPDAVEDPA